MGTMKKIVSTLFCIFVITGCTQQSNQVITTCTDTSNPEFTQELVYITDKTGSMEGYKAAIGMKFESKKDLDAAVDRAKESEGKYNQYSWIDFSYTAENNILTTKIVYDFKSVTPQEVKDAGFTGFIDGDKFSNIINDKEIENIKLRGAGFVCVEK